VSPIHCVIVKDDPRLPDAYTQFFTYGLCHLYYNWTGAISVPATIQVRHVLEKQKSNSSFCCVWRINR
jgi:aubergine-like protein